MALQRTESLIEYNHFSSLDKIVIHEFIHSDHFFLSAKTNKGTPSVESEGKNLIKLESKLM